MRQTLMALFFVTFAGGIAAADIDLTPFLQQGKRPVQKNYYKPRVLSGAPVKKTQPAVEVSMSEDSQAKNEKMVPAVASPKSEKQNGSTATLQTGAYNYTDPVTGMEFLAVKGGCYTRAHDMVDRDSWFHTGEKMPTYEVCVSDFSLGKYEVTQTQWMRIMGSNPSHFNHPESDYPVENISWQDVQEFIRRLNALGSAQYRLPTEAEWEYAARSGGKMQKFAGTNDYDERLEYAWFEKNSDNTTHPVGLKRANGLGLHDMSGNVDEWCSDWYEENGYATSPRENPEGPLTGTARVIRGSSYSWRSIAWPEVYHRQRAAPEYTGSGTGFRLVVALPG